MLNPINKEIKVANAIDDLVFLFKAKFNNGDILYQEDGCSFNNDVKPRFNELKEFSLHSKELQKSFFVDLENGIISSDNLKHKSEDVKNNIRLIYFRRNLVEYCGNLQIKSKQIIYFLGLQYNDLQGNNRKIVLQIYENGEFEI
jgi:hypothetical protein